MHVHIHTLMYMHVECYTHKMLQINIIVKQTTYLQTKIYADICYSVKEALLFSLLYAHDICIGYEALLIYGGIKLEQRGGHAASSWVYLGERVGLTAFCSVALKQLFETTTKTVASIFTRV